MLWCKEHPVSSQLWKNLKSTQCQNKVLHHRPVRFRFLLKSKWISATRQQQRSQDSFHGNFASLDNVTRGQKLPPGCCCWRRRVSFIFGRCCFRELRQEGKQKKIIFSKPLQSTLPLFALLSRPETCSCCSLRRFIQKESFYLGLKMREKSRRDHLIVSILLGWSLHSSSKSLQKYWDYNLVINGQKNEQRLKLLDWFLLTNLPIVYNTFGLMCSLKVGY